MSDLERLPNGQWPKGVSGGGRGGRKPKANTADDALLEAFDEKVVSTEGTKRRRITKVRATAKQIANEGATGKSARQALAMLQKANERRESAPKATTLTATDEVIVARLVAHLRDMFEREKDDGDACTDLA